MSSSEDCLSDVTISVVILSVKQVVIDACLSWNIIVFVQREWPTRNTLNYKTC